MSGQYPIVINCRDRVASLAQLVSWLEGIGQQRIALVDNASTYPPLLEYYERSPHTVIRLGDNVGQLAPWLVGIVGSHVRPDEWYVETDPDVIPVEKCPADALDVFRAAMERYPSAAKAGFGLKIDDLPRHYRHAEEVRRWESQFWRHRLNPGEDPPLYAAPIDTTFAMYRPGALPTLDTGIRTGGHYVARHTAWYVDSDRLDDEERYYRARARGDITSWNSDDLADRVRAAVDTQPPPPPRRWGAPRSWWAARRRA